MIELGNKFTPLSYQDEIRKQIHIIQFHYNLGNKLQSAVFKIKLGIKLVLLVSTIKLGNRSHRSYRPMVSSRYNPLGWWETTFIIMANPM